MSNNHPNDNIYSILGKLDALKPTPEEKHQSLIKEIRESVEALGSITEGVSSVETRLTEKYMGFKKTVDAIKKGGSAENPEAVAAAIGRKKYGKEKFQKAAAAGKKMGEGEVTQTATGIKHRSTNAYGGTPKEKDPLATLDKARTNRAEKAMGIKFDHGHRNEVTVDEKAPPGAKAERMVKGIKKSLSKDGHLSDKDKAIAYATTWKAHNKGQVEEAGKMCAECGMNEGECEHTVAEAEITRTAGKTVHRKTDFPGYPADDINNPDIEPTDRQRGRPRKHAVTAPKLSSTGEKLGRGRPKKDAAPTYSTSNDPFGRVPSKAPNGVKGKVHTMAESMDQLNLALTQLLSESRLMDDAGETIGHILNRFRAEVRNFEQGGDLDNELYDALYDYYVECGEMPYGVQKARTGDPQEWVATNLESHLRGGNIVGGNPDEDYGMEREGIEMEAGIPGNVPTEKIPGKEDLLKGKGRSYYEEDSLEEELNELAKLAGLSEETRGQWLKTKADGAPTVDAFGQKNIPVSGSKSEVDEEESPKADKDYDQDGKIESEKDEVIGSRRKAAGLDESIGMADGSSDFNISTNMNNGGHKEVSVTATGDHAATLLQMLRIAGLGDSPAAQELQQEPEIAVVADEGNEFSGELAKARAQHADSFEVDGKEYPVDEDSVEVDQPSVAPQNSPNEKYGTIKNITTQGDDLNRQKRQDPGTANKAANPLTNAQQVLKSVAQLESKLAAEYESIKKISR